MDLGGDRTGQGCSQELPKILAPFYCGEEELEMVDNFPCVSWPMGTGTLEHDTATVPANSQPGKVSPALPEL